MIFFLRHVSMGRAGFKYVYPLVDKFSLYLEYLVTYILGNSYRFYLAGQMSRYGKTLHAFFGKTIVDGRVVTGGRRLAAVFLEFWMSN